MNTIKNTLQKILAVVIAIALVFINVPVAMIFAGNSNETEYEEVQMKIVVTAVDQSQMTNAYFSVVEEDGHEIIDMVQGTIVTASTEHVSGGDNENSDNENSANEDSDNEDSNNEDSDNENNNVAGTTDGTSNEDDEYDGQQNENEEITYTNEYTLTINKAVDSELVVKVFDQNDSSHYAYVEYDENKDESEVYPITLTRYAKINNTGFALDNNTYTYTATYSKHTNKNEYTITFPYAVNCTVNETGDDAEAVTLSSSDEGETWTIKYSKPGDYSILISTAENSTVITNTYLNVKVDNELKYDYWKNKKLSGVVIESDDYDIVTNAKKKVDSADEEVKLELTSAYDEKFQYTSSNTNVAVIKVDEDGNSDGTVVIKGVGETIITAKGTGDSATASYRLVVEATDTYVSLYEDINNNNQKDNGERTIIQGQELTYDALNMIGSTVKIPVKVDTPSWYQDDWYTITYDSSNKNVADVAGDGTVTIKGVGEAEITATVSTNKYFVIGTDISYNIKVNASDVNAAVLNTDNNQELGTDSVITLWDTEDPDDNDAITLDAEGNEVIVLPLDVELYVQNGEQRHVLELDGIDVELSATVNGKELDFNGYAVTNHEEIIRNEEFTLDIKITDPNGRINEINKSVKILLNGNRTNNADNQYYIVSDSFVDGFDGKLWKKPEIDVVVTAKEGLYSVGAQDNSYYMGSSYVVKVGEAEPWNKEHKIYVKPSASNTFIHTRLFFGVDEHLPEIDEILYDDSIVTTAYGNFADSSVSVSVVGNDGYTDNGTFYNGNLYGAVLNDKDGDTREIDNITPVDGKYTFNFTLEAKAEPVVYSGVSVLVRDVAKNTSEVKVLNDILIEQGAPNASIELVKDDTVSTYPGAENKLYASDDVQLAVSVTDLVNTDDESLVSGIKSYEVWINDVKAEELSKDLTASQTKNVTVPFNINTAGYEKNADGSIKVQIKNISDMAGNVTPECDPYIIYIDNQAPTAVYDGAATEGEVNITPYGNFYNNNVTYTFAVSDNMTGLQSVTLAVGEDEYTGNVTDGKVSFDLPIGKSGEVVLTVTDNVGLSSIYKLNEITDVTGARPFISAYVLVENIHTKISFDNLRAADKGNWYNAGISYDITLKEAGVGAEASGIKAVTIYVNDREYLTKSYTDNTVVNDTFKVNVDNHWIDTVINNNGSYTIRVVVADNAGNINEDERTVYIDKVAPVISDLTGVVEGSSNTGVVTVNVEVAEKHYAESGNTTTVNVTKTLDGQTTTYEAGKFTATSDKTKVPYTFREDGTYEVVVTSEDAAGNKAVSKKIRFIIDNTAPLADITGVTENAYYTEGRNVTLSVVESNFADMDVVVAISRELNGQITPVESLAFNKTGKNSTLTQTFAEEGTYTIKIDAVDKAGNVALTRTVIFTVDTSAPTVEITGVDNGKAYKDAVIPSIKVYDNYYRNYTVSLTKTGVYSNGEVTKVDSYKSVDVTDDFIGNLKAITDGAEGTFNTFDKIQANDGIYTLTVTATDLAGRTTTETRTFSVNRFGSVYTFDENLTNVIGTYNKSIDTDFRITEYNADKLVADSVKVTITRDGSPLDNVLVEKSDITAVNTPGESGWYQYEYVISKDNFALDGVYVITVTSEDVAGNNSETITYDQLAVRFSVDTTKPEVVKVTGLSEDMYNAKNVVVNYQVFDAVGIKEVRVFLAGNCIQTITEFTDITSYEGSFSIEEGMEQHIRFEVIDMAGNIVDSDNADDMAAGKIVDFNNTVTVSTSAFVRWYANKPLFYGSIAAGGTAAAGGASAIVLRRRRLKLK